MLRKSALHVLLSLLLLITQQLSLGHGYSHWTEATQRIAASIMADQDADADPTGKQQKPALHDLCGQCAASAQIAFAVAPTTRRFVAPELAYGAPNIVPSPGICRLTACAFQPRGPPLAG